MSALRTKRPCHSDWGFTIQKTNATTGEGLAGAVFTLFCAGVPIQSVVSDTHGRVVFSAVPPGCYELEETKAPPGYWRDSSLHQLIVGCAGNVCVNGCPVSRFVVPNQPVLAQGSFVAQKIDADTGLPLAGAVFGLSPEVGAMKMAVSDTAGMLLFGGLLPGRYTLTELMPPPGYVHLPNVYAVVVDAGGSVTIDGQPGNGFLLRNTHTASLGVLNLNKNSYGTGGPLAGAVFELRSNGVIVQTQTTDSAGQAIFADLVPGAYMLEETQAPPFYPPNPVLFAVTVLPSGTVLVDDVETATLDVMNFPYVTELSGSKYWNDNGNAAGIRPPAVTIFVLQNGIVIDQFEIPSSNGVVAFSIADLILYDPDGVPYVYTVAEDTPPGYTATITDNDIVNSLI